MYNNDIYPALQTFSIERLRKEQERALTPILAGRDVLVRLRTGGGKSLLYHLPALLDEPGSLTLVFSPLRALQRDQITGTRAQRRARRPAELRPQHVHAR